MEKGVAHELCETNVFDPAMLDPGYETIHPFRRIPALDHDGFQLYETGAIARYVDEAMPGPALQPSGKRARARMNQIVSVVDSYAYPSLIRGLVVERLFAANEGRAPDERVVADSLAAGRHCLTALGGLATQPYLTGTRFTLADAWLVSIVAYLWPVAEGATLLREFPALVRWWQTVADLPSVTATRYPKER
jgi:glutathione S-transferase